MFCLLLNVHVGRTKNHNSESKSLCNLAFAQSQLKDFQAASKSFSNALAKAHLAKNNFLQFQACEGLGSVHYQMGQFGETVSYFNQALGILNSIKEDTGVARERVMEKLSDASEALERMKERYTQGEDTPQSPNKSPECDGLCTPCSSSDEEAGVRIQNDTPNQLSPVLNRRLSPEFTSAVDSESKNHVDLERLPLPEKRGSLPPIDTSQSPQMTSIKLSTDSATTLNSSEERKPSKKHVTTAKRRGRLERLPQISESGSHHSNSKSRDSYDAQLEAYVDSYRESPHKNELSSSSSESNLLAGSEQHDGESGDELGASIFSRHATHTHKQKQRMRSFSPRPPSIIEGASPISNKQQYVGEGSLAIGPNARELFTTETRVIENGQERKKRKRPHVKTEIVAKVPGSPTQQQSSRRGSSQAQTDSRSSNPNTSSSQQQSKVCVIL